VAILYPINFLAVIDLNKGIDFQLVWTGIALKISDRKLECIE